LDPSTVEVDAFEARPSAPIDEFAIALGTELVADAPTQQALLKHLGETVFKGRGIKMRVRDADGKPQIGTFKGSA
jgi:hypothetical protein